MSSDLGREGYGITRLFYGLLLQFMEDLSDRECERFLQENLSGKWLCGFGLGEAVLAPIMMNHMLAKNHDKDRWFSHLRMLDERVFFKRNPRVGYRGLAKNQFAAFKSAISFNLKRLLVVNPPGFVFS